MPGNHPTGPIEPATPTDPAGPKPPRDPDSNVEVTPLDEDKHIDDGIEVNET
jgi:hypothetical protein